MEESLLVTQFKHFNIEIHGTYDEPLFKAKDIGDLLDIKKIRKTIENLDDECKILKGAPTGGGLQEQWFLTEDEQEFTDKLQMQLATDKMVPKFVEVEIPIFKTKYIYSEMDPDIDELFT